MIDRSVTGWEVAVLIFLSCEEEEPWHQNKNVNL